MSNLAAGSKRKVMEQDVDTDDYEERSMMQQPRSKFSVMEPQADEGDVIDEELPGSVCMETAAAKPRDMLDPQQQAGNLNKITTHTHPEMADPALASARRRQHRTEVQAPGGAAPDDIPLGAEEGAQDPKEQFNETGVPIEPFNLDREREEGRFDAGGGYTPNNFPQVKDAWLDSIDDAGGVQGTDGDLSTDHPDVHPANDEEVREAPPELPGGELRQYRQTILQLLQADETIPEALRRLSQSGQQQNASEAQAGPSLEQKLEKKLGGFGQDSGVNPAQNKPKHKHHQQHQQPSQTLQTAPNDNRQAADRLTEAAEVLLDHGESDIYSWTRQQVQRQLAHLDHSQQGPTAKRPTTQASAQTHSVDPQTFQASTAGELTYGKDKAHDMLKLKRSTGDDDSSSRGLAQPQDVSGSTGAVRRAAQSVDASTQPSQLQQVQAGSSAQGQPSTSSQPAPAINPVGASSNYSNKSMIPINSKSATQNRQGRTTAAPSSRTDTAQPVSSTSVDVARHADAITAADEPPPGSNTSRLDTPGLSQPQDNTLPGYQVEALGRAHGQKAGAHDQNKPQDHIGTAAEPGQGRGQGNSHNDPLGSAERPIHAVGATDIPHGAAVEPSYKQAPQSNSKEDVSYKQAAADFAISPTDAQHNK